MTKILNFFRTRSVGFYICCAAAVLSVVEAIVYKSAVRDPRYYSDASFFLALFAFLPFALLSVFKVTERYAPAALALMVFFALMTFLAPQSGYMGDIIYGARPSARYIATVVLLLLGLGMGIAGIFMRTSKKEKRTTVGAAFDGAKEE